MTTANTNVAVSQVEVAIREATRVAILEGDLEDAQILLSMLRGFKVSFNQTTCLNAVEADLCRRGCKIDAIKSVRGRIANCGLKEAKDLVEKEMERMGVNYGLNR